jgi:S-DNA-T family DNA segregation ATPase FtsK/SpoIIIE
VFPFQAALVTGTTRRDETVPIKVNRFVFGPDPVLVDSDAAAAAAAPSTPEGPTDLEKLVAAAAEAAQIQGLKVPRRPWPDTLPEVLAQAELIAEAGGEGAARIGVGPAYGLADVPDRQCRALYCWSPVLGNAFVCGVAGSGTTETLGSMAVALAKEYRPEKLWLYALDFGTQALAPLAGLPHCGGVIGSADRERQFRLVRFLAEELERRRKHVATSGAVKIDPADPNSPFPAIVLLIDNYGALSAAWEDGPGMQIKDILTRTIADGPGLGVTAIISTDRPLSLPGALGSVIPNKMALRLADPSDLSFFGLNPREVGKLGFGRGVDASTKLEVQIANAHADGLAAAVSEAVTAIGAVDSTVRPPAIGTLPDEVPIALVAERLQVGASGDWFLPIGISDSTLAPAGLRMAEGEHVLIAGAARSGKSTTLEAIAAMVAEAHPEVVLTAVAVRRSPLQETPEIRRLVKAAGDIDGAITEALADPAPQLVLIDDADALPDTPTGALANLVNTARPDVHVVVAGRGDTLRSDYMHWSVKVRNSRQGLALKPDDMDANLWNSSFPREKPPAWPPGRGYLIADGVADLVQAARRA